MEAYSFALFTCTTFLPVSVQASCPSALTVKSASSLGLISTVTTSSAETTMERLVRVCAEMGVMAMICASAFSTGPPADRLYAVEPVGVQMMTPSAEGCPHTPH